MEAAEAVLTVLQAAEEPAEERDHSNCVKTYNR